MKIVMSINSMDENPSSRAHIERNRRNQMKALYSNLTSLHPSLSQTASLPDQLEAATNYIQTLRANLEEMKQKKKWLSANSTSSSVDLPSIDIRVVGSALEVVLITGQNSQFMFNGLIRILHQHGVEVTSASFSAALHNTVFHTIHSKIGLCAEDCEVERISERLRKFVYDSS